MGHLQTEFENNPLIPSMFLRANNRTDERTDGRTDSAIP